MLVRKETSLRTQRNSCSKIFSIPHLFYILLQLYIFSKKKIYIRRLRSSIRMVPRSVLKG